ncbi:MAG: hypothetical protein E7620_05395 [Ruminococcaceae bacterium]|nr:hypothetical protein [Oscillospiraceae bacterium]
MKRVVKYLGIDFGSSNTLISAIVEGVETPLLFRDEITGFDSFETMIPGDNNQELRALKEQLLESRGNEPFGKENVRKFFAKLREKLDSLDNEGFDFSKIQRVCFGHPAYYDKSYVAFFCDTMKAIIGEIFVGVPANQICAVSEPLLDAYAYCHAMKKRRQGTACPFQNGQNLLVLDMGGHTIDMTLLRAERAGEEFSAIPMFSSASSNTPVVYMGKAITENICDVCYEGMKIYYDADVDKAKGEVLSDAKNWNTKVVSRVLKKSGGRALYLTYDEENFERERIPENAIRVAMRSLQFDTFTIDCVIRAVNTYLKTAGLNEGTLDYVLLTGGSSKIIPLQEGLKSGLRRYNWLRNSEDPILLMDKCTNNQQYSPLMKRHDITKTEKGDVYLSSENAVVLGAILVAADESEQYSTLDEAELSSRKSARFAEADHPNVLKHRVSKLVGVLRRCRSVISGQPELIKDVDRILFGNGQFKK